jgi:hypothetical protein
MKGGNGLKREKFDHRGVYANHVWIYQSYMTLLRSEAFKKV